MSGAPRRVLVVEDQEDLALVVRMLLEERGIDARVEQDAESALCAVRAFAPQVVLVDLTLPGMSGEELARRLRAEHGRDVTLVALTGHEGEDIRRRCMDAGFDHFVTKPYRLEALERVLDEFAVV